MCPLPKPRARAGRPAAPVASIPLRTTLGAGLDQRHRSKCSTSLLARALAWRKLPKNNRPLHGPCLPVRGRLRASREGEPRNRRWIDGVPVHVRLDGGNAPLKTIIVAAFPRRRHQEPVRVMGGLESLTVDLPDLLERYDHAEVEDGTVRLQLDGMVVDDLEQKLHDAARIARAFATSATS